MAEPRARHRVFGIELESAFPLAHRLAPGSAGSDPELVFTVGTAPPFEPPWEDLVPTYVSPQRGDDGEHVSAFYRLPGWDVLRFSRFADYYLSDRRIHCHLRASDHAYLVEIRLLGPVLAFWLERRGMPVLHASALTGDGGTIALVARGGGGKSTLAAALLGSGWSLLSDDLLVLERRDGRILARPGYPQLRLWPDQAEWLVADWQRLPRVHPRYPKVRLGIEDEGLGSFCDRPRVLDRIYLLDRRPAGGALAIEPLTPGKALIELIWGSFLGPVVEAAGLQGARLDLFAALLASAPLYRLDYPAGYERLPEVTAALGRGSVVDRSGPRAV